MTKKAILLVAHNANFDATRLIKSIVKCNLQNEFNVISFTHSSKIFRKTFSELKGPGMFKLSNLVSEILGNPNNEGFYDAEYDVEILQKLILAVGIEPDLIKYKIDYSFYITEELSYGNVLRN